MDPVVPIYAPGFVPPPPWVRLRSPRPPPSAWVGVHPLLPRCAWEWVGVWLHGLVGVLAPPGSPWLLLAPGSFLLSLAPPVPPGSMQLAPPGSSWLLLAAPGSSWLPQLARALWLEASGSPAPLGPLCPPPHQPPSGKPPPGSLLREASSGKPIWEASSGKPPPRETREASSGKPPPGSLLRENWHFMQNLKFCAGLKNCGQILWKRCFPVVKLCENCNPVISTS